MSSAGRLRKGLGITGPRDLVDSAGQLAGLFGGQVNRFPRADIDRDIIAESVGLGADLVAAVWVAHGV